MSNLFGIWRFFSTHNQKVKGRVWKGPANILVCWYYKPILAYRRYIGKVYMFSYTRQHLHCFIRQGKMLGLAI